MFLTSKQISNKTHTPNERECVKAKGFQTEQQSFMGNDYMITVSQ